MNGRVIGTIRYLVAVAAFLGLVFGAGCSAHAGADVGTPSYQGG